MREYSLLSPMYVILIGGADVVLDNQRLRTLGMVSTNYNELSMMFELEGIHYELKGLKFAPSWVINSQRRENLLKKGSSGVMVKLYSMEVK
jgi:hypothetical protein